MHAISYTESVSKGWCIQGLDLRSQLVATIAAVLDEHGNVKDSASDEVRRTRGKLRAVEGRLRGILKGHGGEVTEHVSFHPHGQNAFM